MLTFVSDFIMASANEIGSHDDTIELFELLNDSVISSDSSDSDDSSSDSSGDESRPSSGSSSSSSQSSDSNTDSDSTTQ